jgi:hypothetical protein
VDLNHRSPGYEPDEITWLLQLATPPLMPQLFEASGKA